MGFFFLEMAIAPLEYSPLSDDEMFIFSEIELNTLHSKV